MSSRHHTNTTLSSLHTSPQAKGPRVFFHTFGCRLNQAETASLQNSFVQQGYRLCHDAAHADIAVINTCTVTENGVQDLKRLTRRIMRQNPKTRIALIGCQAQVEKEALTRLSGVTWVIGNGRKMESAFIIKENPLPASPLIDTTAPNKGSFTIPFAATDAHRTRAHLKIQDGCDFFCSFCEIPYARGRARSRSFEDILNEAKTLLDFGHQEIVITGVNIGTFEDRGHRLHHVMEALCDLKGLLRLRLSSIEPTTVSDQVVDLLCSHPKVCAHLHLPLQSASDRILKSMNRVYRVADYLDFITMIKTRRPDLCLGTDVIAGFPDETEEDFLQTHAFLKDNPIDHIHVFSYSSRPHARSRHKKSWSIEEVARRSRLLRELARRKQQIFRWQQSGTRQRVLFEQRKNGLWMGWTDNYIRCAVASPHDWAHRAAWVRLGDPVNDRLDLKADILGWIPQETKKPSHHRIGLPWDKNQAMLIE